jgi:hypothetical protein
MTEPTDFPATGDSESTDNQRGPEKAKSTATGRNTRLLTAAATGIGSAALLGALLYANRSRKPKKPDAD